MGGNNSVPVDTTRDEKKEQTVTEHDLSRAHANPHPSPQKDANAHSSPDANEVENNQPGVSKPHTNHPALGGVYAFQFNDECRRWFKEHRTPIATSFASVSSTLVAYPLDFVKARMQAYNTKLVPTLVEAYKHEGVKGMYKGCITPIYSIALVRMISFSTYNEVKHRYDAYSQRRFGVSPLDMANATGQYPNIHTISCFFVSGAAGGAVIPWVAAPFELVKLQSQLAGKMVRDNPVRTSTNKIKTGTWRPALQMIRERGFFSLWTGFWLHLARDTLGTAIYFSVYEAVKQTLANARGHDPTDMGASMFAGGLTGIVSWIIIYPIDVKKTQYQKRFLSHEVIKETATINFFKASGYRGLGVSMLRSGVINALFFPAFEACKRVLKVGYPEITDNDLD